MDLRNIIVIGGSAGASGVLLQICRALPTDFAASVFVVTHFQHRGPEGLKAMLADACALPVDVAIDGQPVEPGRICLAAADRHLLLARGVVRLGAGPMENLMRPAIDPLFRSAALAYGPRAIGLVLSGRMDDGASGLAAIKARGGLALVQHPKVAQAPSMPEAALAATEVDNVLHDDEIAPALIRLASRPAPTEIAGPNPELELEVKIAAGANPGAGKLRSMADPSTLTCPTCHGVLSEVRNGAPLRYRCQTGHAFTAETALAAQQTEVDEAVLIALRVMEERLTLVSRMAQEAREQGRGAIAKLHERRAEEYAGYAATLRQAAARALEAELVE
jgi:two-component system chemotaxis response regulator CheB